MNFINTQPVVKNIGRQKWQLMEDYKCYFELSGIWYKLVIYKGFVYDGASIPRFAWSILGKTPMGQHDSGTIFHDLAYMIKNGTIGNACHHIAYVALPSGWETVKALVLTRKEADQIMFDIIRNTEGVVIDRKMNRRLRLMYRAVRIFGQIAWRRTTNNNEINPKRCD